MGKVTEKMDGDLEEFDAETSGPKRRVRASSADEERARVESCAGAWKPKRHVVPTEDEFADVHVGTEDLVLEGRAEIEHRRFEGARNHVLGPVRGDVEIATARIEPAVLALLGKSRRRRQEEKEGDRDDWVCRLHVTRS